MACPRCSAWGDGTRLTAGELNMFRLSDGQKSVDDSHFESAIDRNDK